MASNINYVQFKEIQLMQFIENKMYLKSWLTVEINFSM